MILFRIMYLAQITTLMCYILVDSNSRNNIPQVAQNHGRAQPAPCVCPVFCMHIYSFAGLINRMPPPTFSDTAITNRHSDTIFFQLRAHWVQISWSIGSEKPFGHVPQVGVKPLTCVNVPYPLRFTNFVP